MKQEIGKLQEEIKDLKKVLKMFLRRKLQKLSRTFVSYKKI